MRGLLLVAATVSSALTAGVFLAFSTFVLRALADLGPRDAARAMRAVNQRAPSPVFMALLFGSTLLGVVAGVAAWGSGARWWAGAGALLSLVALAVTVAVNVPLNDRLERSPGNDGAAWAAFASPWLRASHVRAVLGAVAALLFALALRSSG